MDSLSLEDGSGDMSDIDLFFLILICYAIFELAGFTKHNLGDPV